MGELSKQQRKQHSEQPPVHASQVPAAVLPAALCKGVHQHGPTVLSTTWKTQGMQL